MNLGANHDRATTLLIAALAGAALASGCPSVPSTSTTTTLAWTVSPDPPQVGDAALEVSLKDAASQPVGGARLTVEGHMTHPGMRPVLAELTDVGDGRYQAKIAFTMAGDWVLLVRGQLRAGERLERDLPLRVRP